MKNLKYLLKMMVFVLTINNAWADRHQEISEAKAQAFKAVQSYPEVQSLQKRVLHKSSKRASSVVPVDGKQLQIVAALAASAAAGRITTRPLNIKTKVQDVTVTPLYEYDRKERSRGSVNLNYNF